MSLQARDRERIIQQQQARQEGWTRWSTPFRYVSFIVIVLSIVTGLWFLIEESSEPVPQSSLQTVLPEEEPYKVKVDDQEILSVRHQDKLVYSRIHKGDDVPQIEHILPAPEAPVIVEASQETPSEVQVIIEGLPIEAKTALESPVAEAPTPKMKATAESVIIEAVEVESGLDSIASLINQEGLAQPSGPFVQLGTLDSQEQAQQEWKRLKGRHQDILSQDTPLIEQVDLGERGIHYRLRVGPYNKLSDAQSAAKELKVRKVGCIVIP
jgi:cell division septation protein DedD